MLASFLSAFANILAYGIIQIANHTTFKGYDHSISLLNSSDRVATPDGDGYLLSRVL